jgi:ribosomal protein L6P/L9E
MSAPQDPIARTLIAGTITGHTTGHSFPLYLFGVPFRAVLRLDPLPVPKNIIVGGGPDVARTRLTTDLRYSGIVYVAVPKSVDVALPGPTTIMELGIDKAKVGQFAAGYYNAEKVWSVSR